MKRKTYYSALFWLNAAFLVLNFIVAFIFMELNHSIKWIILFMIVNVIGMRACVKTNELNDKIQKLKDDIDKRRMK